MRSIVHLKAFSKVALLLGAVMVLTTKQLLAQAVPEVPAQIMFADMQLNLSADARRTIQADVDALYSNMKFFLIKLERVDFYFPLIEQILREEEMPDDFKYLVIQESGLVSDAVSTSNAVGFWQFKKESGQEVGLRIDDKVDERMNIVSSTHGAAKYLKRNNFLFDNWVYALLSYNLGRTGAEKVVDKKYYGSRKMPIDKDTHWYVLKFLAHKIAFENVIGQNSSPARTLMVFENGANRSLSELSEELKVEEQVLLDYNKWLKSGKVPSEKAYAVVYPLANADAKPLQAYNSSNNIKANVSNPDEEVFDHKGVNVMPLLVTVNSLPAIMARQGDNLAILATHGGITKDKFIKYNEIEPSHKVIPGQIYYLKPKRSKAKIHYHTLQENESLWVVSQKYGIKEKAILRKNRIQSQKEIKQGLVLWLRFIRPSKEPMEYKEVELTASVEKKPTLPVPVEEREDDEIGMEKEEFLMASEDEVSDTDLEEDDEEDDEIEDEMDEEEFEDDIPEEYELEEIEAKPENKVNGQQENGDFDSNEEVRFVEVKDKGNQKPKMHTVEQGETLYGIAKRYQVTVSELKEWNELDLGDGIKIGQILKLEKPEGKKEQVERPKITQNTDEAYIFHIVSEGETLYKIAREYQVTIKDVMEWNDKKEFNVSIGEKIKIFTK
jgi:membrane-bound lytic murein transglycosylase D